MWPSIGSMQTEKVIRHTFTANNLLSYKISTYKWNNPWITIHDIWLGNGKKDEETLPLLHSYSELFCKSYHQTSTMRTIRKIISQAHVPKCWYLRHILSISMRTFVVKRAFKTWLSFWRKYYLKGLSSIDWFWVCHPNVTGILSSVTRFQQAI